MVKNMGDANYSALILKYSLNKSDIIAKSSYLAFVRQSVRRQSLKRQKIPVGIITYGLRCFPEKPP